MSHAAPASRFEALLWPPLERRHPHAHLGPLAAFFDLCEARYDRPMLFHTPPPLAPMVLCARVPAELALRDLSAFTRTHGHLPPSDIDASEVPLAGLRAYVDLVGTADDDEAVLVGLTLLGKLASTDAGAAAVASSAVLLPICEVTSRGVPASRGKAPPFHIATTSSTVRSTSTQVAAALCDLLSAVAATSVPSRDLVLRSRGAEAVAAVALNFGDDLPTLRAATRTMQILCTKCPPHSAHLLKPIVGVLAALLRHPNGDLRLDALSTLASMTDGSIELIQLGIPLVPNVVDLLEHLALTDETHLSAALRIVGNIATGNDSQTEALIVSRVLESFPALIAHPNAAIRKEACWILSNIAAGSSSQIQAVIDAGLIPLLLDIIRHGTDADVVKEAVWGIANLTSGGLPEQMALITTTEAFGSLLHRLTTMRDARVQSVLLEALENCFAADSASVNTFRAIEGSVAMLSDLGDSSQFQEVYQPIQSILETYFSDFDFGNAGKDECEGQNPHRGQPDYSF